MPSYVSNLTKLQKKYEQDGKNWHRPTQGRERIYRQKEGDSSLFWAPKLREGGEGGVGGRRREREEREREREEREKRTLDAHTSREKEREREKREQSVVTAPRSRQGEEGKLRIIYLLNNNNNTFFRGERREGRSCIRKRYTHTLFCAPPVIEKLRYPS